MGKRTSHPHGTFSWVDLQTTDANAAKAFYSKLFGWTFDDEPAGETAVYSMAKLDGDAVAAVFGMNDEMKQSGMRPRWQSYITVDDVNAAADKVKAAGGEVVAPPFDVFEDGIMTVVKDPTGAFVQLWQPKKSIGAQRVNDVNCFSWNELATDDVDAAKKFYGDVMGWTFQASEGGPGPYFLIKNGERMNGGMMPKPPDMPAEVPSHWAVYFTVADCDATVSQAKEMGATVVVEPTDIPVGRFAVILDPQGAAFVVIKAHQLDD